MKNSRTIALAAILSALSVALLFIGSASQIMDLSCAAMASIIVVYAVIELKGVWPYLIYAVTSLISLLILPDKFASVIYFLFAGYYPMLKLLFEKMRKPVVEWILKLVVFNAAISGIIWVSLQFLYLEEEGVAFTWIVYAVSNAVFILFDIALTRLISAYLAVWRKRFKFLRKQ